MIVFALLLYGAMYLLVATVYVLCYITGVTLIVLWHLCRWSYRRLHETYVRREYQ